MKSIVFASAALLLATACMEKRADGTYHVTAVTQQKTQTAANDAKDDLKAVGDAASRKAHEINQSDAGKHLQSGAKEIGVAAKEGAAEVAQSAGAALERAGAKLHAKAQEQQQTSTTTTVTTTTRTTTQH